MARIPRSRRLSTTRHIRSSYPSIPSYHFKRPKSISNQSRSASCHKKKHCDWKDATCSVCMECPHNAVLLLCSSHEKGCRPYMCATSFRHSNCLDQFKKAYTKSLEPGSPWTGSTKSDSDSLTCPLCRGQVKGWTIVEPAREFLNAKRRNCMQDGCNFVGTYRELRKHVKGDHPCAKPREVDPSVEQKWRTLEHERERQDVISTIRSSMPRGVVFGDYVIEMDGDDSDEDDDEERDNDRDLRDDDQNRGVDRSVFYFFLREGARLMRFNDGESGRDEGAEVARVFDEDGDGDDVGPFRRRRHVRFV